MSAGIEEAEQPGTRPVARVLLDSALPQLDHLFDYAIPSELQESLRVGHRVRVPFRSKDRKSFGYVIEFVDRSEFGGELSPIADVVSPVPLLTPEVWRLARAVADRAGGSAGDILRLGIPTRMVRVEKQHLAAAADADAAGVDSAEADATAAAEEGAAGGDTAEGQRGVDVGADGSVGAEDTRSTEGTVGGVVSVGAEDSDGAESSDDSEDSDDSANSDVVADSVDSVGSAGPTSSVKFTVAADSDDSVASAGSGERADSTAGDIAPGPKLAPETEVARELITGARLALTASHGPERLHTGEWVGGWAAQLARIAIAVFEEGRSVICAVPDWRDLDQLRDALAAFGHEGAVRVDSRQSNGERYAGFLRALDHEPRIIIGNRSAVYAPAYQLGAILMWDDGDSVLAEPLAPYVHARDAALVRAGQAGAGLFFAAHSRSAEVQRLADIGYVRAQHNPPRRTRVVHADASMTPDVFAGRVPEIAARTIREALKDGPVLVQVATPGYAPIAVCHDCGELARCRACAGPIGFRSAQRAACRWCGTNAVSWQCTECDGRHLAERGMGSERTVEQFERQFAGARVLLSDGEHARERVDARPALVVATRGAEPIAAGGYRAVVLLDAERLLARESLRSAEDCVRWWENAAALAAPDGHCLLASGGGPAVRAFVTGRTEEWLHSELGDRHELRYPPAVRVASVTGGHTEVNRALDTLAGLAGVDHLGPTPLPAGGPSKTPEGLMRAIVRFDYARGGEVAARLRGALVADAAGATSRTKARAPGRARPEALRLRFDDRGVFEG